MATLTDTSNNETFSMSNPFQDQFLKAGLVNKQQVQKAKQDKQKVKKQQHNNKKIKVVDENKIKIQQAAEEKVQRDRELNQKKQEQARQKAISAEIDQLIRTNRIERDHNCDIAYNFEHQKKIKRIYINEEMQKQIVQGKLGIARITGQYELIPKAIAEKIQQRNDKRVVLFQEEKQEIDANDPYAEHQIPDDLMW
ncbi:MAG: DUF2058 domain-containing protein [Gammaproteobacteria bacterium]|nr:DUF2058 domain-containing protein [Gammaproteobacteria bacterium]